MKTVFEQIEALYGINPSEMTAYPSHEGGRNLVYRSEGKVIRI